MESWNQFLPKWAYELMLFRAGMEYAEEDPAKILLF